MTNEDMQGHGPEDVTPETDASPSTGMSRRRFLRTSALAAGTAAIAGPAFKTVAADLVESDDGQVVGYTDTPMQPWAPEYHVHDPNRPWPPVVEPGELCCPGEISQGPPSDAIVLFDGEDTSAFEPHEWEVEDGVLVARGDDIVTRESFGDCQLHIEWMAPDPPRGDRFDRGNSGVFFMNNYELQIFDSYSDKVFADGIAGAIYGQTPPLVHPMRPPGEWNVFDCVFTAPVFNGNDVEQPATLTMYWNGLLAHYNTIIHGPVAHRSINEYSPHPPELPLMIQEHDNPVRFRNIWIRRLDIKDRAAV